MEQIIRHYGRAVCAAVAAIFMTALLFGGAGGSDEKEGLLKKTGAAIRPGSIAYTQYVDYAAFQEEAKRPEPVLTERFGQAAFYTEREYVLPDYLDAVDTNGKRYAVCIEEVVDETGGTEGIEQTQSGVWRFRKEGIYEVRIMVRTDAGKRNRYQIAIPVMRKTESGGNDEKSGA